MAIHTLAPDTGRNVHCTCGAEYSQIGNLMAHIRREEESSPTPVRYAIRHTFPNGRTLERYPYLTVPGRPSLVLTGTLEESERTAERCRANNPGHTFEVVPY